jgi:sulfate permease, SulP family
MVTPTLSPLLPDSMDVPSTGSVLRSPALLLRECLAGVVTSLALIPEVISFSVVSGVDPKVSLVASVVLGLTLSLLGGRPAMVSAAAGSVALVIGPSVRAHGVQFVLPIVLLAGLIQIAFGVARLDRWLRFVPRAVMLGFVNALGILIFCAQLPHVLQQPPAVYLLFGLTLAIVQLFPRLSQAVPSPLVAVAATTVLAGLAGFDVPTVGPGGTLAPGLPGWTPWLVPLDADSLRIVLPPALSVAFVGLLESLLTAQLVDEITQTPSDKSRESWALGVANLCAGMYGGIAGCAMIGQTVVNVQIGRARSRVSTAVAALVLLAFVTGLSGVLAKIPMVALAAVMMVVALKTIHWPGLRWFALRRAPVAETGALALTVMVTVWTGNLALGVTAGVSLALLFTRRRVEATG